MFINRHDANAGFQAPAAKEMRTEAFLGCYAENSGTLLSTFREDLWDPSSGGKIRKDLDLEVRNVAINQRTF